jgi:hypothetical protein
VTTTVPKPKRRPSLRERLLSKAIINFETGCWEWQGGHNANEYGRIRVTGSKSMHLTHRVAYELFVGPIPSGLFIDHLCRNRKCLRPDHLEPVTNRENLMRSPITFAGKRVTKTHCVNGHEFTAENTAIRKGDGTRVCRTCQRAHQRSYQARIKATRQEVTA